MCLLPDGTLPADRELDLRHLSFMWRHKLFSKKLGGISNYFIALHLDYCYCCFIVAQVV